MKTRYTVRTSALMSAAAVLGLAAPAFAQTQTQTSATPLENQPPSTPATTGDATTDDIVVTGSRIDRAGYDSPTPTVVLGAADLRQGNRVSVAQILDDLPQFRAAGLPTQGTGDTNSNAAVADLRGLGPNRTLTLLNGHRFAGSGDLNVIPTSLIKRVDVVTGGASAAWGSGAVAGVVNIMLDDNLVGTTLGVENGISTRGDGVRYGANGSFGTDFAGGRAHFMIGAQYLKEEGIYGRNNGDRPNLDASVFTTPTGGLVLANDVNFLNATPGGVITNGALAGFSFNRDGTLSPVSRGSQSNATRTVGGTSRSQNDYLPIATPYQRINTFARISYDLTDDLKIWADAGFSRIWGDYQSFPEVPTLTLSKNNAFLSPAVRAQLAAGPDTFTLGRILGDPGGFESYKYARRNIEAAVGLDGKFGDTWRYSVYYDHGELRNREGFYNQRITANFNNAIDAVANPAGGAPICRVALTTPTTACRPLNLFGLGNSDPAAVAYAFATADQVYRTITTKLDTTGASLRGDPFSTWAGPVSIALGTDLRWEKLVTNALDPLTAARALSFNASSTQGAFNVQEGFAEAVVPLLNIEHGLTLEANGAARYSHYSTSGGIWSWKVGGTAHVLDDFLLRAVYSRDIRSPTISELFITQTQSTTSVIDPFRNNQSFLVTRFGGGNPNLQPETSHTLTIGGSYSPTSVPGLSVSLDYYRINIKDVIGTISAQDAVTQCFNGNPNACATITRDSSGQIVSLLGTSVNLAFYKTHGYDFDMRYVLPLSRLGGADGSALRFRGLVTYVPELLINNGVTTINRAGDVGDTASFTTPKWKGTGSITFETPAAALDLRLRYVGGGTFNSQQAIANNKIGSRTYIDLGAQVKAGPFTIYGTINNVFDRDPPFVTYTTAIYDVVGRYFSAGVKLSF